LPTVTQQLNKELEVIKVETAPVISRANSLKVADPQSYALADSFLSKLVAARKTVKTRLARIIDPIKDALKEAQSLLKEVDAPLETAELTVRGRMRDYKLEEARLENLAKIQRDLDAARLRREADAKALAESKAKTQQMRDKLAAQRAELETQADVAQTAPSPQLATSAKTGTRTVKVPKVTDIYALLEAIGSQRLYGGQPIPIELVVVSMSAIKQLYKLSPGRVEKWPGIEMIDDIQIVHRG